MDIFSQEIDSLPKKSSSFFWSQHFWGHVSRNDVVLRTYLSESQNLKDRLMAEERTPEFKELVSETPLPPYVWVTEMSTPGLFAQDGKYLALAVLDPTDEPCERLWLLQTVPGVLRYRTAKADETHTYFFEDDHPRDHLTR
jgi:hypothetical protein